VPAYEKGGAKQYEEVRMAIEEMDEKETKATLVIQKWFRMFLTIRAVNKLRAKKKLKPFKFESKAKDAKDAKDTKDAKAAPSKQKTKDLDKKPQSKKDKKPAPK
jgi:hypothetical protein